MGSDPIDAFGAIRRRPWTSLLILLITVSAALLLALRSNLSFFLDDWALVIYREGGPSDWLLPHNEHIIVLPAAIYKLSLATFGMTAMPLHLLAVALFIGSVILLYLWLRPLIGEPLSVLGCAVVLFLGAATADLVWAFQIGFFGSTASGLGALLVMRRRDLKGDAWASALLVVSVLFSSVAIPFSVGAATWLLFRNGPRPDWAGCLRRSWLFLVPAAVYVGWWLGWGYLAASSISAANLLKGPLYVLSSLGYSASILLGAFPLVTIAGGLVWSLPGLAVAAALGIALHRGRRIPPEFLVAAAIGLTFWGLSALNYMPGREFSSSRYAYPGAIVMLMLLAGAFAGRRPGPRVIRMAAAVTTFAVLVNLAALFYTYKDSYKFYEQRNLVSLSAIDIASRTVDPAFAVGISPDDKALVFAGDYLAAIEKYGSPGLSETELQRSSAENRARLDQYLVGALPALPMPAARVVPERASCEVLAADAEATETIGVDSRLLFIRPRNDVTVRLGRFREGATAWAWPIAGGKPTGYGIPADRATIPWRIGFEGSGEVTVCDARAARGR